VLAPALQSGLVDAFFVAAGRIVARRTLPPGADARAEIDAALAIAATAATDGPCYEPDHLDDLLVIGSFLKHPPPELRVLPLDSDQILAFLSTRPSAAA
jgi:hypothetical protein